MSIFKYKVRARLASPFLLDLATVCSNTLFKIRLVNIEIVYILLRSAHETWYFYAANTRRLYKTVAYSRYIVELTLDVRVTYKDILQLSRVDFQN